MKLSFQTVDVDQINTDGGTQVRADLDQEWLAEICSLYEEAHPLPRPIVMVDQQDVMWLVDGFHRLEAHKRLGRTGIEVDILMGSLDMAKLAAARSNQNGLPRNEGDKKRAILLARETKAGRDMTQRELARHVGCTHGFVAKVLGANLMLPMKHDVAAACDPRLAKRELRRSDIRRLTEAGKRPSDLVSLGFHATEIAEVRRLCGIKKPRDLAKERAKKLWDEDPTLTLKSVADALGTKNMGLLRDIRSQLGVAAAPRQTSGRNQVSESPVSAPPRKRDDPRDKAEVLIKRPTSELSVSPPPPMPKTQAVVIPITRERTQPQQATFVERLVALYESGDRAEQIAGFQALEQRERANKGRLSQ